VFRIDIPDEFASHPKAYVNATLAPEITSAALKFYRACYESTHLSLREFEGARIRVAEINGCSICQGWRSGSHAAEMLGAANDATVASVIDHGPAPDEEFYRTVSQWRTSPLYSEREKVAIGFAEYLALDPQGLARDDKFWARVKNSYTDEQIVDLSYCVYSWF
jgi:alkylhydroperoxidase family enzyme